VDPVEVETGLGEVLELLAEELVRLELVVVLAAGHDGQRFTIGWVGLWQVGVMVDMLVESRGAERGGTV
jgi:hypothetical protein